MRRPCLHRSNDSRRRRSARGRRMGVDQMRGHKDHRSGGVARCMPKDQPGTRRCRIMRQRSHQPFESPG